MVLSKFNDIENSAVDLLRRAEQLCPLVRRLLIEEATKELNPPENLLQQALSNHCQQEQLKNEEALDNWLSGRFISKDELLLQLSLPIKLSKLALDAFAAKSEARFLQRKEALDQAIYSLIIYLRIQLLLHLNGLMTSLVKYLGSFLFLLVMISKCLV